MSSRRRGYFETYSKLGNRRQITSFILKKLLLRITSNSSRSRYTKGRIPWLWMSIEALKGISTIKGDV